RLTGRAVADDQLALAAADRDHGVDRLDTGLDRDVHALAGHNVRGDALDGAAAVRVDRAPAVDRGAQRGHDAPEERLAHRHVGDTPRSLDLHALFDLRVVAEDEDADGLLFQVHGQAGDAVLELHQLAVHALGQAVRAGDTVAGLDDRADVDRGRLRTELL